MTHRAARARQSVSACVAFGLALVAGPCGAQPAAMPMTIALEPSSEAKSLFYEGDGIGGPLELVPPDQIGSQPLAVAIPMPAAPLSNGVLTVDWDDSSSSAFPIVLGAAFTAHSVYVKLFNRGIDETPKQSAVSKACTQIRPDTSDEAFEMFFACRAMALQLENAGKAWLKPHRTAMAGWLIANYFLYTRNPPVSPYGADPDLLSRLRDAIQQDDDDPGRDWRPLRLPDARTLLQLVDDQTVRLAGQVPALIGIGDYAIAAEVNAAAIAAFRPDQTGAYGLNEQLLLDNQVFLEQMIAE